jgi:hypothetical protein
MKDNPFLRGFIPKDQLSVEVKEDLELVVKRITTLIPTDKVYELFSSTPNETGGKSNFPYCRVDSQLIVCRNWLYIFEKFGAKDSKDFNRIYENAAISAFKAIVWVEIGFQGLDNLAESRASVNWTSGVGHFVNDQQRSERIKTNGREMYEQMLGNFVNFRDSHDIRGDIFTTYNAEDLLNKFRNI